MAEIPGGPEDVSGYGKVEPTKGFDKETRIKPDEKKFRSFMEEEPAAQKTTAPSPAQMTERPQLTSPPTLDSLLSQINTSQTTMQNIQSLLQDPNLQLKSSQTRLLKNKLGDAQKTIRSTAKTIGAKQTDLKKLPARSDPITKFLGYVSNSQNQIEEVKTQLNDYASSGQKMQPSVLLSAQVKLAQAQQTLEYSSVLLSKTLEAIKQTLNIQM